MKAIRFYATTRDEAEQALDANKLFVRMSSGAWWLVRRNGATKTWKRKPNSFRIPFKMGFRSHGAIDETNFQSFRIAESREVAQGTEPVV